jgi:PAS domain S-box-containing protein
MFRGILPQRRPVSDRGRSLRQPLDRRVIGGAVDDSPGSGAARTADGLVDHNTDEAGRLNSEAQPPDGARWQRAAAKWAAAQSGDAALQARIEKIEARLAASPPTGDPHVNALYAGLRTLIGELVRRQRNAEEMSQTLTAVLESTSDAFVALDSEWRYTYVNERAGQLLERDPASLVGKHIWTEFPEGVGQPFHAAYEQAVAEQRPLQIEAYYPPFGRWFENRIYPHAGGVAIFFQDVTERRSAEARLRESEALFRAVYEQAAIGIALADMDERFIHVNPFLCRMLGYEERELRERYRSDITHPDDRAAQAEHTARVLAGAVGPSSLEKRYLRKDGSEVWARVTLSVVRDAHGAPRHYVVIVEDISERVRVEAALRESEARYERTVANVPGMVFQFVRHPDGSFEVPFVSAGAREIFGVTPEQARSPSEGFALYQLIHPEDRASWERSVAESAMTLSDWRWTGRVLLPSGEVNWIEGASRPARQPDGRVIWDGIVMDVSERLQAAQRLEASEQRYRSLFDHHPDAVYVLDPNGVFVSANPACTALSGYRPEELVGHPFEPIVAPDQLEAVTAHFRAALEGKARSFTTAIRHRSGRRVEIEVTNVPMMVADQITGVFGIARDLTATRELEAQLRQAQKMEAVGRLAGGVAHDFNNLLTVITSCSRFVAERVRGDPVASADVDAVLSAAARAADLTRQLLAFGRQQMLQPRRLDVNEQFARVAGMLRRVIGEDISVITELDADLWPATADPGQLEQVLMNLAVNARDAMPGGGTLRFQTANVAADWLEAHPHAGLQPDRYVSFAVEDSGTGIDASVLPNIFDPFFTTKGPGLGSGLGLPMVYGIIEQSGGHIYVDSTPGLGSRFTVLLPRADLSSGERGEAAAGLIPHGTEAILVVEDDPAVRGVVRRMLESQGYDVAEAAGGEEARQTLEERAGRVDLLLVDVVMPDQNGRALAEQLTERWPSLRVVFMSGYTDDEILRRGLMRPGMAFLAKPFTPDRLAHAVREALDAAPPATGV